SKRLGLPPRLRDVDIPRSAIPKMAEDAMVQARLLVNNPREVTQADAQAIYEAAW
ncbi:MAG TPA: alcohol dehydrogenase, partial [Sulfitobacter sp.]|nr:alcohol dehydrogenase [Sulfitobacter sp.]